MRLEKLEETITLPDEVTASYDVATKRFVVTGPKGEIAKIFFDPRITITVADGKTVFSSKPAAMQQKKRLYTFRAHLRNMIQGVTQGFTYKLKVCSGHFPMTVSVKGRTFEIKNFIGEKVPRRLAIKEGADVQVEGEIVTVTGTNKEIVGQVAADIEKLSRRPGFDSRIFQDGIFITEKDKKKFI